MFDFHKIKLFFASDRPWSNDITKEFGKFFLDLSKIIFVVIMVLNIIVGEDFSFSLLFLMIVFFIIGIYYVNKGAKSD